MAKNAKEDALSQCPYYKEDKEQMVCCEGPYQKSRIHLGYGNSRHLREHKRDYCNGQWHRCALAEMNNRRYNYDPR